MRELETRQYFWPGPGRFDAQGVEWFKTDGYSGWYRWKDGELIINDKPNFHSIDTHQTPLQQSLWTVAESLPMPQMREVLYNEDPNCLHDTEDPTDGLRSGIKCNKCSGWFCY